MVFLACYLCQLLKALKTLFISSQELTIELYCHVEKEQHDQEVEDLCHSAHYVKGLASPESL